MELMRTTNPSQEVEEDLAQQGERRRAQQEMEEGQAEDGRHHPLKHVGWREGYFCRSRLMQRLYEGTGGTRYSQATGSMRGAGYDYDGRTKGTHQDW